MDLRKLRLPKAGVVAVIDTQWGDTGKGKIVDLLSSWANVIARGTGGANAGHTIVTGKSQHVFHLIPSGILRDGVGTINIIGSGVALDPAIMCEELEILKREGLSYRHLKIAYNAHLVLPQHLVVDRIREQEAGAAKIGTTGRGIGPLYSDHVGRQGLKVFDMLDLSRFRQKLISNLAPKIAYLRQFDESVVREVMHHKHLQEGRFWHDTEIFGIDAIVEAYAEYAEMLRPMIFATDGFLWDAVKEGCSRILLEGAQGTLLSIDHGIYPKVTSSDCSIAGLAKGVGISERNVDLVFGIVKAPFMTRVGEGVFPTEMGQPNDSDYPDASINSDDPREQCVAIRKEGKEFGATTGRPRRIGWLDLPLLRYSLFFGGDALILTKLDVLNWSKSIKLCTNYIYRGPDYDFGDCALSFGDSVDVALGDDELMSYMEPVYQVFPGWEMDISTITDAAELPANLMAIVKFIEVASGRKIKMVSVGPDRDQTIIL